jgi:hypothetical protein
VKARQFLRKAHEVAKACDSQVSRIISGGECKSPAVFVLLFRFFKRIVRHLTNIVSSVVMPIDKLDYFDEDYRQKVERQMVNEEREGPPGPERQIGKDPDA